MRNFKSRFKAINKPNVQSKLGAAITKIQYSLFCLNNWIREEILCKSYLEFDYIKLILLKPTRNA